MGGERIHASGAEKALKSDSKEDFHHEIQGRSGQQHQFTPPSPASPIPHRQHLKPSLASLSLFSRPEHVSTRRHQHGFRHELGFPSCVRAHGTWPSREPPAVLSFPPSYCLPSAINDRSVGTGGTGPCVTVNGGSADAAAPGSRSIN